MKNTIEAVVLYLIIFQTIQIYECLHCYACNGKDECGISFSSNSSTIERVESKGDDFLDVCTISVNSEGITTRGLILSPMCRSSANQFCCKEDWCNSLPAPPLPALTSRTCRIDRCLGTNNKCDGISNIATLSSATESCTGTLVESEQPVMMTYKKKCAPGQYAATQDGSSTLAQYFCCNSPECNQQRVPSKVAIQCYTCDSRVTGLAGCSTLNLSSPHVYESGSSDSTEACATVIGFKGIDSFTNVTYPAFFIRTFIQHCNNQSLGNISYGGATFQGRINCCWKNHCNIENLYVTISLSVATEGLPSKIIGNDLRRISIIRIAIFVGFAFLISAVFIVYQFRRKISQYMYRPLLSDAPLPSTEPAE
ncbi:unnamed protein product [Rotaria magnacalcarata]|uniref:Sodefrin-like factor n=2 Tax=Rotaria magnacalcarata TaxID=392030 RepID=A0A815IDC8_9BILA|nr:unnamed protein product [Rotaria magnacalcarata]